MGKFLAGFMTCLLLVIVLGNGDVQKAGKTVWTSALHAGEVTAQRIASVTGF